MLVLSRKPLESVIIGSDIRITLIKVEGSHVRIGIEAPSETVILRAELLDSQTSLATTGPKRENAVAAV